LFGAKVVASDSWIIVGAPGEAAAPDFGESGVGAVYAFRRDDLHGDALPIRPPPGNAHSFGASILFDGKTLLVGAPGSDGCPGEPAFNSAGIIVRYELGASGKWEVQECISATGERAGLFGWSMAMNDAWLVVGAPWSWGHTPTLVQGARPLEQATGASAGLAYVFERQNGEFVPSCVLEAPNADPCDDFGQAVAFGSDFLAVGAYGEDGSRGGTTKPDRDNLRMDSGAVYLYGLPRAH
jgi:hypothetical protein